MSTYGFLLVFLSVYTAVFVTPFSSLFLKQVVFTCVALYICAFYCFKTLHVLSALNVVVGVIQIVRSE